MTDIETRNQYNVKHWDMLDDNADIEFLFEEEAFEHWLKTTDSRRGTKRTRKTVFSVLNNCKRAFISMGNVMSVEGVRLYRGGLIDADYAPQHINKMMSALKCYTKFLAEKYGNPHVKNFPIRLAKTQPKQFIENVISRADYDFLVSEARKDLKQPNIYLGVRIMGTTGVRRCELLQVKVEHIKHGYVDVIGKGNKQRRIYFPKNAREELLEYLAELGVTSGYVIRRWHNVYDSKYFTANTRDGGSLSEQLKFERLFSRQLERAGEKYGIAPELMHAHGFRHFFAKEFLKHRLDLALLADLLGHSKLDITRIYLKMTSREQADVVDETVTW